MLKEAVVPKKQKSILEVDFAESCTTCIGKVKGRVPAFMLITNERTRSLFYLVMHGETRYFENISSLDAAALCKAYTKCHLPFVEMTQYGREIGIEEYAGIEQGECLSFSLEFNSDNNEIVIFDGIKCVRKNMGILINNE